MKPNEIFSDNKLLNLDKLIEFIKGENERQIKKWGIQRYTLFEWQTYTTEELGSLAKAISEYVYRGGPTEKVMSEAIQVATLSLKIAEMVMIKNAHLDKTY